MNKSPKTISIREKVNVNGGVTMPVAKPSQKPTTSETPSKTTDKKSNP